MNSTQVTATLTSYQLSTDHSYVWPQEKINERLEWIFQHCRYALWINYNAEGDAAALYVGLLDPRDSVAIVYVLEP